MKNDNLYKLANHFKTKIAQQAPAGNYGPKQYGEDLGHFNTETPKTIPIANSQLRQNALQFFGDLYVNELGFLFKNPTPQEAVQDIKQSRIDDNEIKAIINRYLPKIQEEINFLSQFKNRAGQLVK